MAKLKDDSLDIASIISRMIEVSGVKNNTQLAKLLDLSPPALNQLRKRKSISLHLLLLISNEYKCSLDYLVFGREYKAPLFPPKDEGYVEIVPLNSDDGKILFFPKDLLPTSDKKGFFLKSHVVGEKIWIINVRDHHLADGVFAFGTSNSPVFRRCRIEWDGNVLIGDDQKPKTRDEINSVGLLGRVVWQGYSV